MKTLLFLLFFAGATTSLLAQKDTSDNYVQRFVSIPPINVYVLPDSTLYSNQQLKKDKPFMLMFFSPDCEHCQKETKELIAYKEELKGIQILMLSSFTYKEIKDFYDAYGLAAMPNVTLGQDLNLKLARVYKVKSYPSIFVYDNRGILAKAFVGNIGVPAILDAVK